MKKTPALLVDGDEDTLDLLATQISERFPELALYKAIYTPRADESNQAADRAGHDLGRGGDLLRLMAHDMRSPLITARASLTPLLEKLERYGPLTKKQERALKRALRNIGRIQQIIQDFIETGMAETGVFRRGWTSLLEVLRGTLEEIFETVDHTIASSIAGAEDYARIKEALSESAVTLDVGDEIVSTPLYADRGKLVQILRNLASNALKHGSPRVVFRAALTEESLVVSVRDFGPGIPEAYRETIFSPYHQLEMKSKGVARGYGLGLSGAAEVARQMGGELRLDSDITDGALFVFSMPRMLLSGPPEGEGDGKEGG